MKCTGYTVLKLDNRTLFGKRLLLTKLIFSVANSYENVTKYRPIKVKVKSKAIPITGLGGL
jgi:hypothetical protein